MKNFVDFLQHMKFASLITFIAIVSTFLLSVSNFIEKMFGKKYIGTWAFEFIKSRFTFQSRIEKMLTEQNVKIAEISKEVTYNGGTYKLRDAVADLREQIANISDNQAVSISNQHALIDCSPIAMFMNDADDNLERANPAWMKLLGVTNFNEVSGGGWIKLIPKEDKADVLANLKMNSYSEFSDKVRLVNQTTKDVAWYMCRTSFQRDRQGKKVKVIGTLEPIE